VASRPAWTCTQIPSCTLAGTSYRPANWIRVGQTKGRVKLDHTHAKALPVKDVYLYPPHRAHKTILTAPAHPDIAHRRPGPSPPGTGSPNMYRSSKWGSKNSKNPARPSSLNSTPTNYTNATLTARLVPIRPQELVTTSQVRVPQQG